MKRREQTSATDVEQRFVEQLPVIERATAFICRRYRLSPSESEDFASTVKLKLIENDYAILRKFEGRSTFSTFITITIRRMLFDLWTQERGKWNPSAEARRLGEVGVALETMLHREERPLAEVIPIVSSTYGLSAADVEAMAGRLPARRPRPRLVDLARVDEETGVGPQVVEEDAMETERRDLARRAAGVIRRALERLSADDRAILRLRFFAGLTVAEIARSLHLDQKMLYRRITQHFSAIREALGKEGIEGSALELVLDRIPDEFARSVRNARIHPSSGMEMSDDQGVSR
jgi:RNA polymerase sigma factor for flagellar operon FliA